MATTVVFGGGPGSGSGTRRALNGVDPGPVIAADSGLVACTRAGLRADVIVGDMDSVPVELLEQATAGGARVEVYPRDKDATDLQLALDLALELCLGRSGRGTPAADPEELLVFGGDGGRLDHLVAGMTLLGAPAYAAMEIEAWLGATRVIPVHDRRRISVVPSSTVSLLALHGPVSAVSTSGLRWPLEGGELHPGNTLGVSNRSVGREIEVEVGGPGVVTVVVPDPHVDPRPGLSDPEEITRMEQT